MTFSKIILDIIMNKKQVVCGRNCMLYNTIICEWPDP